MCDPFSLLQTFPVPLQLSWLSKKATGKTLIWNLFTVLSWLLNSEWMEQKSEILFVWSYNKGMYRFNPEFEAKITDQLFGLHFWWLIQRGMRQPNQTKLHPSDRERCVTQEVRHQPCWVFLGRLQHSSSSFLETQRWNRETLLWCHQS